MTVSSMRMPPKDQLVTASDLVRHFGEWQERAARSPVYIMHRGRPRLVMTSVAVMEDLCQPHEQGTAATNRAALSALLDASREMILLVNDELRLVAISRSARAHFGSSAQVGAQLDTLVRGVSGQFAYDSARRTLETGIPETVEIMSEHRPGRRLSIATEPHPEGMVMLLRDVTDQHATDEARAEAHAMMDAVMECRGAAVVRINQRGYLCGADPSLAALTGVAASALANLRFANLIEIGTRVPVMETVDAVLTTGRPGRVDAKLLVTHGGPIPVRIGLGPVREGATVQGVLALIAAA